MTTCPRVATTCNRVVCGSESGEALSFAAFFCGAFCSSGGHSGTADRSSISLKTVNEDDGRISSDEQVAEAVTVIDPGHEFRAVAGHHERIGVG